MKQFFSIILLIIMVLSLAACDRKTQNDDTIVFYYPRYQITYGTEDGLISTESIDQINQDIIAILQTYLRGPSDLTLKNPFPHNTTVISAKQKDTLITLVLSDEFAALTGIELTVACVCLAKTTFDLTGTTAVTITCQNQMIDGEQSLTFHNDGLLFWDNCKGYVTVSTEPTDATE